MDHVVTGLAALKIMPKNMESVLKVVDDSFHWSDKAFNVSCIFVYCLLMNAHL